MIDIEKTTTNVIVGRDSVNVTSHKLPYGSSLYSSDENPDLSENYFSRLSKDKYYVMEYNEKVSTIEILRKKIDLFLANELSGKKSAIENHAF